MKPIYIAAYHQSPFGKLGDVSVPDIIARAVSSVCDDAQIDPADIDVGAVAAACNFTLNRQGLLAGLMAMVPGLAGKPIEAVENACASGGQAVLSVINKLLAGDGSVGIAVGYEKMRDAAGKADGKLIGEVLGFFSHPADREGKVFVFPHLFAEVMAAYIAEHGATARDLATIAVTEYANAKHNPFAQMRNVDLTLDVAERLEGINRCIVEGLPLKTYDCSQITDGYASMIVATDEGLAKLGIAPGRVRAHCGMGTGHRPAAEGQPRRAAARRRLSRDAARLRPGRHHAQRGQRRRGPRLLHRHGGDWHRGHRQGRGRPGGEVLGRRQGRGRRRVRDQLVGRAHRQGPSDWRHRGRDDRMGRLAVARQGPGAAAGQGPARGRHLQHRWPHLRVGLHGVDAVALSP